LDPTEVQKLYDQYKPQLAERDQYHLRMIDVKTEAKAQKALEALKKLPFETVALTQSDDPVSGPKNGDVGFVMDTGLPPPLLEGVKKLKPGEYTQQIIKALVPPYRGTGQPTTQPETRFFIVQLVEIKKGRTPTI